MIARRYGVLPTAIKDLSAEDFSFARLVFYAGLENDEKQAAKQKKLHTAQLRGLRSR